MGALCGIATVRAEYFVSYGKIAGVAGSYCGTPGICVRTGGHNSSSGCARTNLFQNIIILRS